MSSDVSCQSQDASKHNQGSYASTNVNSAPSSCDPLSLWGSRRSSEVSSVERLSPSSSMRLSSLRSELPVIEDANPTNTTQNTANICDKNEKSPKMQIKGNPPDYFQATSSQNQMQNFSGCSNFNLITDQSTITNDSNRLTPIPQSPQFFTNSGDCNNENIDWNSNGMIEKNTDLERNEQETSALENNKDLILPDDLVDYLNEVSNQEAQANTACFQKQNSFPSEIKPDCCTACKQDPHENQNFHNSCCNQSTLSNAKLFYPNCAISHHMNFSPNTCASHDVARYNCIDSQNTFNQNQSNFQTVVGNGCKSEFAPQPCNQMTSQHTMGGCGQQSWNTQTAPAGGYQNQMCSSHNVNAPTFYCNQQRYINPPSYQVPNQYSVNNHQMQMIDNRCHMANCGSPQSIHVPQMFCNHNQAHPIQTQPVYQCSGQFCSDIPNMQTNYSQMNQNYNLYPQQGNQMLSHLPQYHQCSNCGAGQTFSHNHCYANNSVQQRNLHHSVQSQFVPPSHSVQCTPQPPAQTCSIPNNTADVRCQSSNELSLPNTVEKTIDTNNQAYIPPKTENNNLQSTCANNLRSAAAATGGNTTMSIQNSTFENNINHQTNITSSAAPPSAQSILPTENMVINDMNSILSSLMEETKYLKLLQ